MVQAVLRCQSLLFRRTRMKTDTVVGSGGERMQDRTCIPSFGCYFLMYVPSLSFPFEMSD